MSALLELPGRGGLAIAAAGARLKVIAPIGVLTLELRAVLIRRNVSVTDSIRSDPCSVCGRFAFPIPESVCYLCRRGPAPLPAEVADGR